MVMSHSNTSFGTGNLNAKEKSSELLKAVSLEEIERNSEVAHIPPLQSLYVRSDLTAVNTFRFYQFFFFSSWFSSFINI